MNGKRLIKQGQKILVRFSLRERDLICEHVFAEPDLTDRLKLTLLEKDKIVVKYSLDELNGLLESISAKANHALDAGLEKELDRIFDHIILICNSYTEK
jgi:hypothetical protein